MTPDEHYVQAEKCGELFETEAHSPARVLTEFELEGIKWLAMFHATLANAVDAYDRVVISKTMAPVRKYEGHTYQEGGITNP